VTEIPQGTVITPAMVAVKRPGTGLPPKYLDWVVGRPARKDISANQTITFDYV
jgi:N,N'-diacetyllegionaminate synthase